MITISRYTKQSISIPIVKKNNWSENITFSVTNDSGLVILNVSPPSTSGMANLSLSFEVAANGSTPIGQHLVYITGNPLPQNPLTISFSVVEGGGST